MQYNHVYEQLLQKHYHASLYRGELPGYTHTSGAQNPSCGDEITLQCKEQAGVVVCMRFQVSGCVVSHIAASVLAQYCEQKTVHELRDYSVEQLVALLGIEFGPNRMQCVALAVHALHKLLV